MSLISIRYYVLCIMGILLLYIIHTTNYILPVAYAQTPSASTIPYTLTPIPSPVPPTSPIYTDLLVNNMFHTFSCLMVGSSMIGQPCLTYQITKNAQGAIQSVPVLSQVNLQGGALGGVTSVIAMLYLNQPVRTSEYLASVGQGLGIVKEAHAQVAGSGAGVLSPILKLWQVSRNIAYVIMIVVFVIIGLMIMFRNKINPQTVITAQAALPGLVIGLILITFSYFLASLVTDTAYLGVNLIGYYFNAAQTGSTPKLTQDITTENIGSIFGRFVGLLSQGDISNIVNVLLNSLEGGVQFWVRLFAGLISFQAGSALGGPVGSLGASTICTLAPNVVLPGLGGLVSLATLGPFCSLIGSVVGGAALGTAFAAFTFTNPAGTIGWILYFAALAALIYTMFKLLLRLLNNYLAIIFLTLSAPFQFLAASLPGRQGIATAWILNMLCNVLSFPAVFAVFYFAAYLLGPTSSSGQFFGITEQLNPTATQTLPLFGGINLSFVRLLLAFGALLATPAIPDIICRTIGRMGQAGQLLGQEISGATGSGQRYAGQAQGSVGQIYGRYSKVGETYYGSAPPGASIAGILEDKGVPLRSAFGARWRPPPRSP